MTNTSQIESVRVITGCPACGSTGYEFDLEPDDLNANVSYPCDDCDQHIEIVVNVLVTDVTP